MIVSALNVEDTLERQREKLLKINAVLMRRVEQSTDSASAAYAQFERAAMLEEEVRARTRDLNRTLDLLNQSNAALERANEEAERARSDLANAIETVKEGFALFDPSGELVMCNSRFGANMPDVRQHLAPGLSFDDYVDMVSRSAHLALPDGETARDWARQRRARHTDEHVMFNVRLWGDRWIQVSEHRTAPGGTVILQTDVSDMMRLERQERDRMLDDQARVIRATLEHISQGVCIFDEKARLIGWNRRVGMLLSLPFTRFALGSGFLQVFNGLTDAARCDGGSLSPLGDWVRQRDRPAPAPFDVRRAARTLAVSAQPMPDAGFVVSFTDVSAERDALRIISEAKNTLERRVAERTLELEEAVAVAERANATKSRFVAAASHDLLQPLSAAKLYLSSLEAEPAIAPFANVVGKARSALSSVETILDALLDISRLDSGAIALDITDVPLAAVMGQLADEFGPLAAQKGLDLRVVSSRAVVRSDPTYMRRILQNLIANAVKYTGSGKVLVGTRRSGGSVRLEVWDTGPGIPPERQRDIFQEFQRLDATASASEGMGLGLAIVERACTLLRHPLELVSAVGRGSRFMVTVPASPFAAGRSDGEGLGAETLPGPLRQLIVLLVDGECELRQALATLLESWGATVLEASTRDEALSLIEEIGIAPDIVLVAAPRDGALVAVEDAATVRRVCGSIPACVISADRAAAVAEACERRQVTLVAKPIDPQALRAVLGDQARQGRPSGLGGRI